MTDVEESFRTNQEKVRHVIEEYRDRYPDLWENYTLVMLLVIREEGVFIPPDAIEAAARGELPNLTSVHRALTLVKKDYQTPEQKFKSYATEEKWREMFAGLRTEAEGWDG